MCKECEQIPEKEDTQIVNKNRKIAQYLNH